jgi:Tol biopolymer transport system component
MTHQSGAVEFDISADGSLVYVAAAANAADAARTLAWVDRTGREETIVAEPRAYTSPHLSPNGTKAAFDVRDREQDIWIWDFSRQNLTRLTLDAARERAPIWLDDRRVAFESERDGKLRLYSQAADGTGVPERIGDIEHEQGQIFQPKSVSRDGKWLVVTYPTPPTRNVGLLDLMGDRQLKPLIEPGFIKDLPAVSPDGRWITYQSNETGRNEIYVRPFPAIDRRWTISTNGGERAVWSRDGSELFYIEPPGRLMAVSIEPGAEFSAGRPQLLFEGQFAAPGGRAYDVAPDGRFLMMKTVSESESPTASLIVVQNWLEELKRLVPIGSRRP